MKYLKPYNESVKDFLKPISKEKFEKYKEELDNLPISDKLEKIYNNKFLIDLYPSDEIKKMLDESDFRDKIYYIFADDESPFIKLYDNRELTRIKDYHWEKDPKDYEEFWGCKRVKKPKWSDLISNESIKDYLKPKTDEELDKSINKLSKFQKDRMLSDAIQCNGALRLIELLLKNGANIEYVKNSPYHWWWKRGMHKDRKRLIDQYSKTNESIKDFLKPKSEESIMKDIKNLSPVEILKKSVKYNLITGFKYLINNNLLDEYNKYIVEKYILGLSKNEPLKDFEEWLLDKLTNLKISESKTRPNNLIYKKDGVALFNYNTKNNEFHYSDKIGYTLSKNNIYNKFNIEEELVDIIIKKMVEENLNIKISKFVNPIYNIVTK